MARHIRSIFYKPDWIPRVGTPMFAQVRSRMTGRWKGVIISEGLEEPSLLNGFDVYRARISKRDQPIDDRGHKERWHLYWVRATDKQIEALSSQIKDGWYAHF